MNTNLRANPLLLKINMVDISMGEGGQMSKANSKKTMENLTELERMTEKIPLAMRKTLFFSTCYLLLIIVIVCHYSSLALLLVK